MRVKEIGEQSKLWPDFYPHENTSKIIDINQPRKFNS